MVYYLPEGTCYLEDEKIEDVAEWSKAEEVARWLAIMKPVDSRFPKSRTDRPFGLRTHPLAHELPSPLEPVLEAAGRRGGRTAIPQLFPQQFRSSSAAAPQQLRSCSAAAPQQLRSRSVLPPQSFRVTSAVVPCYLRSRSVLPPQHRRNARITTAIGWYAHGGRLWLWLRCVHHHSNGRKQESRGANPATDA